MLEIEVEKGVEGAEERKLQHDLWMDPFVTAVDRLSEMIENPVRKLTNSFSTELCQLCLVCLRSYQRPVRLNQDAFEKLRRKEHKDRMRSMVRALARTVVRNRFDVKQLHCLMQSPAGTRHCACLLTARSVHYIGTGGYDEDTVPTRSIW